MFEFFVYSCAGWLGTLVLIFILFGISNLLVKHHVNKLPSKLTSWVASFHKNAGIITAIAGLAPLPLIVAIMVTWASFQSSVLAGLVALWICSGTLYWIVIFVLDKCSDEVAEIVEWVAMIVVSCCILPLLCYIFYWLWYYLCAGFLVVEAAESFWEQVVYGGITLIGVVFWVGLIMILLRKM